MSLHDDLLICTTILYFGHDCESIFRTASLQIPQCGVGRDRPMLAQNYDIIFFTENFIEQFSCGRVL